MNQHARSRRALRASFVVTVAAGAALLPGCGGALVGPPLAEGDAATDAPTADTPTADTPTTTGCPATQPAPGTACAPTAMACTYGPRDRCGNAASTLYCDPTARTWRSVTSTCNPPPPVCPATQPDEGTACNPVLRACSYGPRDACGNAAVEMLCDARSPTWRRVYSSCNPPPPECPEATPAQGAACDPARVPAECTYGPDCSGTPTTYARCDPATRTWRVARLSCNPPPPPVDAGSPDAG